MKIDLKEYLKIKIHGEKLKVEDLSSELQDILAKPTRDTFEKEIEKMGDCINSKKCLDYSAMTLDADAADCNDCSAYTSEKRTDET